MKKLVIKTALITLASVVGLIALLFGVFAIFIPKPLGDLFYNVGDYSTGMYYYEQQYNKTGSAEDLWTLCLKVDVYGDSLRAEKYLTAFKNQEEFEKYCNTLDKGNTDTFTTEEFIEGKLVCAIFKNKGIDKAIEKATECVTENSMVGGEYTQYNPYFMLYTDNNFILGVPELTKIKAQIDYLCGHEEIGLSGQPEIVTLLNETEFGYASQDIANLNALLGI